MRRIFERRRLGASVALVLLSSACSYNAKPVHVKPPNLYDAQASKDGVVAGAEAFYAPKKSKESLGEDVTDRFLPVLVSVRNDSMELVNVQRSDALLTSSDGKVSHAATWQAMFHTFKNDVSDATALGGLAAGGSAEDANNDMAEDWHRKEFPEQSLLSKGRGIGGFIYFRRIAGAPPYTLTLIAQKMKSQKTVTLHVALE